MELGFKAKIKSKEQRIRRLNGKTSISYSTWNTNEEAQHHRKWQSKPCTNQRQMTPQMEFRLTQGLDPTSIKLATTCFADGSDSRRCNFNEIWANKTLHYSKHVTSISINLNAHESTQIVRTRLQSPKPLPLPTIAKLEGKLKLKPTS